MKVNVRDAASGGVFIVIAGLFALGTMDLAIGTPLRMGPGFFPLTLAGVLALLGGIILAKSLLKETAPFTAIPWRGAFLILLAPIVFGLTVRGFSPLGIPSLGLAPSVALVVFISAFASRLATVKLAVILTVTLTIFCVLVFQRMLGLPIPAFGGPLEWLNPYVDAVLAPVGTALAAAGAALAAVANAIRGLFSA